MKQEKHSILTSLLSVINENDVEDSNYKLANYLLENFDRLDELNMYDIVEECYISRSGIRRFCLSIGLNNFSDVKHHYNEWDHQYEKYCDAARKNGTKEALRESIHRVFDQVEEIATMDFLKEITGLIHGSKNVVFIASEFSAISVKEFQQSMIIAGKVIKIMSSSYVNESLINSLNAKDLIITISVTGRYGENIDKYIKDVNCRKMLITSNTGSEICASYDRIIGLPPNIDICHARDYSKYGISYLLDLIFAFYYEEYVLKGKS